MNYYDEEKNFLFVSKDNNGRLSEHIFIHLEESCNTSFLALFESHQSESPSMIFKLERMSLANKKKTNDNAILKRTDYYQEKVWKRLRVKAVLPSVWEMFFKSIIELQNKSL